MRPVLLLTERTDLSADLVVLALQRAGAEFVRLNLDSYPSEPSISWFSDPGMLGIKVGAEDHESSEFSSAWFRRLPSSTAPVSDSVQPWVKEFVIDERRRLLEGVWEVTPWHWVNYPRAVWHSENKLVQLTQAKRCGFKLPRTLVCSDSEAAVKFVSRYRSVAKAISTASVPAGDKRMLIFTRVVTPADLADIESLEIAPVIFQELIHPKLDVRVTVVGDRVFATVIRVRNPDAATVDWRSVPDEDVSYEVVELPDPITVACRRMMRAFGLNYGAFDFAMSGTSEWFFLELNPSGQWGWIENATGQPITEALAEELLGARTEREN